MSLRNRGGLRLVWLLGFAAIALGFLLRNLAALDNSPPGIYSDEASIGYNAWTIFHFGVDEHGSHLPLYFAAFGEYKNPLYIYISSPIVGLLGLSVVTTRMAAALLGVVAILALSGFAWTVSKSKIVTLFSMLLAGCTPWLVLESRIAFEAISMAACLALALLALAQGLKTGKTSWFIAAGMAGALAVFAYSTGRLAVALLTLGAFYVFAKERRLQPRNWYAMAAPVALAYAVLALWVWRHPGALQARFNAVSIGSDSPGLMTVFGRFVGNYFAYWDPRFFWWSGDSNLRHSTGFEGMLLICAAPLLVAGLVYCWRHRSQSLPRFLLLAAVLAPISAALTEEATPHSLRDVTAAPFLLAISVYGVMWLRQLLWRRKVFLLLWLVVAGFEIGAYQFDLFANYPLRAFDAFDSNYLPAITWARAHAGGHEVWLSNSLNEPYIDALFYYRPQPPQQEMGDNSPGFELRQLAMGQLDSTHPAALRNGDVAILRYNDPLPRGAVEIQDFYVPAGAGEGGFVLARPQMEIRIVRIS